MTANGKLKSAQLRHELARVDAVLAACKVDEAEALAEVRSLARAAIGPDTKDALAKIKAAEGRLGQHRMSARRLHDARGQIEADLAAAIAEEDQQKRKTDAKEAEAFAASLGNLFGEVDRALGEFRRSYTACFAVIREARARGWSVPSEELMVAKMNRALKTAFSVGELRGFDLAPLPSPERCTFNLIGEAYARSIRGGAKHAVLPPKPAAALSSPAAKSDESKLPPRGDVGMKFRDDLPEFEVRIPVAR